MWWYKALEKIIIEVRNRSVSQSKIQEAAKKNKRCIMRKVEKKRIHIRAGAMGHQASAFSPSGYFKKKKKAPTGKKGG